MKREERGEREERGGVPACVRVVCNGVASQRERAGAAKKETNTHTEREREREREREGKRDKENTRA